MNNLTGQVRPLFKISQVKAKQDARTKHSLLAAGDIADFTEFDASIDQAFLDAWAAEMDAADLIPTDEVYRDNMQQKRTIVEGVMRQARNEYGILKFFVLKAFPDNAGIQKEFGFDDYDKARRSTELLHQFVNNMYLTATEHKVALIAPAVAYPVAKIAGLQALALNMLAANTDQESYNDKQLSATRERILALNAIWARRQLIAAAAKLIYMDNYAKYQQYLLPPSEASADDFGIMGMVADAVSNAPLEGVTVTIDAIGVSVTSDENGLYGIADNIPPGDYIIRFNLDGYAEWSTDVTVTSADETVTVNANLTQA